MVARSHKYILYYLYYISNPVERGVGSIPTVAATIPFFLSPFLSLPHIIKSIQILAWKNGADDKTISLMTGFYRSSTFHAKTVDIEFSSEVGQHYPFYSAQKDSIEVPRDRIHTSIHLSSFLFFSFNFSHHHHIRPLPLTRQTGD